MSDITQGLSIIFQEKHENKELYGFVSLGILWLPGIPAAIHYLSIYRMKLEWYWAVIYAFLIFVLYPVVPILALIIVLWVKPKDNKYTLEFSYAQYGATVAYAIKGCIAAPIQLFYQSWLALTGIIPFEWLSFAMTINSPTGNQLPIELPTTAFCIFFSIIM